MEASQAAADQPLAIEPAMSTGAGAFTRPARVTLSLGLILLVGLVHGLVYVFVMPPWQHYDEPNHFEYVWLVANRAGLPQTGDFDPSMRYQVALSMRVHGFFRGVGEPPDLVPQDAPAWIGGYSQLDEPPLYYLLASLPVRVLSSADITTQMYSARLVSLLLFLLTLLAAWGVSAEILPSGSPLYWLAPISVALLPGFVDLMTAVNNDVGAVAFFSTFLWAGTRLVRRGFSFFDALWAAAAAAACVFTKSTAMLALPLLLLTLMLSLAKGRWHAAVWAGAAVAIVAGLVLLLLRDDAAGWYRSSLQTGPVRADSAQAGSGEHVFRIEASAEISPNWIPPLFQPIPAETGQALQGNVVTLGAWMWADRPMQARTPELHQANQAFFKTVQLTEEPAFFAITAQLVESMPRLWIALNPAARAAGTNAIIYLDGLVLAEGVRPEGEAPVFSTLQAQAGEWGGKPFVNLIHNGSVEAPGLRFKSQVDRLGAKILPDQTLPSLLMTSVLDWKNARWFYVPTTLRLFRTFWGQFGWGHVPLLGHSPYRILGFVSLALLLGAAAGLVSLRRILSGHVLLLLGMAILSVWGAAFLRAPVYMATTRFFLPVARYAYPAIIPTMFLLALGGWTILQLPAWAVQQVKPRQTGEDAAARFGKEIRPGSKPAHQWAALAVLGLLVLLDFYSIFSILAYY